jgi:hypothetical protein
MVKLRDARWGYLILFITMFVMSSYAIPSPIPILPWTQKLFNYVDALPAGSLILVANSYGSPGPTFEPFAYAFMYHCFKKDLRLVFVAPALIFVPWVDRMLTETGWGGGGVGAGGKVYGVDYVFLGFLPGMEAGIKSLAENVALVYNDYDYYGKPISSLPIMNDFKSARDISLVMIIYDYNPDPYSWMRQWGISSIYKVPIGLHHYAGPATWLPYWNSGDLIGISSDMDGGAQYETLVGKPGLATALTTLSSTFFLLQAGVIVAASVVFWYTKLTRKKEVT